MNRATFLIPLATLILSACGGGPPPEPPPPDTVIRLDTITITREVEPPLPEGRAATLCLANGQSVQIRVSPAGDTLVGPRRVTLTQLGPGIGFVGEYASRADWFVSDDPITFDGRRYSRFGQPASMECSGLKIIGDFNGVNLFAETDAAEPFAEIFVPVEPGLFQPYRAQVGRVRG